MVQMLRRSRLTLCLPIGLGLKPGETNLSTELFPFWEVNWEVNWGPQLETM